MNKCHFARLDMRMDKSQKISAYEVVNEYKEEKLTEIFYKYAEENLTFLLSFQNSNE